MATWRLTGRRCGGCSRPQPSARAQPGLRPADEALSPPHRRHPVPHRFPSLTRKVLAHLPAGKGNLSKMRRRKCPLFSLCVKKYKKEGNTAHVINAPARGSPTRPLSRRLCQVALCREKASGPLSQGRAWGPACPLGSSSDSDSDPSASSARSHLCRCPLRALHMPQGRSHSHARGRDRVVASC